MNVRPISPELVDVNAAGRMIFGTAPRMKVGIWIATRDDPLFFAEQGRLEAKLAVTSVWTACRRLEQIQLVCRDGSCAAAPCGECNYCSVKSSRWCQLWGDKTPGRVVWWRRLEHPLWEVFRTAGVVVGQPTEFQRQHVITRIAAVVRRRSA